MNTPTHACARKSFSIVIFLTLVCLTLPKARAGLTFTLDFYRNNHGNSYVFYTPLATNNLLPAAANGTYIIQSPSWPTNGSRRAFDLTASGLTDHSDLDSEWVNSDFASALYQITNGFWTILFTNTTTTNLYSFKVTAPNISSNVLPLTTVIFPSDGEYIPTNQTTFRWQGPAGWVASGGFQVYGGSFYQGATLPPGQNEWTVPIPQGNAYYFTFNYLTNLASSVFLASTPLNTNNSQPVSGWASTNILESGDANTFSVFNPGPPAFGHTNLAFWAFDDNNIFTADLSGHHNNIGSIATFENYPFIVTNDTAFGMYAAGFPGGGWLLPPTNLVSVFSGSYSVSLWVKTTNAPANDASSGDQGGGLVAVNQDLAMPMAQTGSKLAFYTVGVPGYPANTLHSITPINTGVYTHVVVTRDAGTGQKTVYVNGQPDVSDFYAPGVMISSQESQMLIGQSTSFAKDFVGEMDQIQVYTGVLSSNDVAFLYQHPGTNVADVSSTDVSLPPVAVYDFEDTNNPGLDTSGNGNDSNCGSGDNSPIDNDTYTTNAASGMYARQYFGHNAFCFDPSQPVFTNLANAFSRGFTLTAWVLTTNTVGNDGDNAYFGNPILFCYTSNTNSLVPLSITGSKLAFAMSDPSGNDTQLHSGVSINDGTYHFIGVTRNATNGLINLYVDGNLAASATGTTNPLVLHSTMFIAGGYYDFYQGILDDVRIYAGELPASDMAKLAGNSTLTFGGAVNAPTLAWTTFGDTPWFIESTNTFDNVAAAQSGIVTNQQASVLSATINGPGNLTFVWASQANNQAGDGNFDYEFDLDGNYEDDLAGDWDWHQDGPFYIPSGPHTVTWTASALGDNDPTEAGFLDQVSFVPSPPLILSAPQISGGYLQFQLVTLSGASYDIQYTTDLTAGWSTYTYLGGNDTTQTINVPISLFGSSMKGFVRVISN